MTPVLKLLFTIPRFPFGLFNIHRKPHKQNTHRRKPYKLIQSDISSFQKSFHAFTVHLLACQSPTVHPYFFTHSILMTSLKQVNNQITSLYTWMFFFTSRSFLHSQHTFLRLFITRFVLLWTLGMHNRTLCIHFRIFSFSLLQLYLSKQLSACVNCINKYGEEDEDKKSSHIHLLLQIHGDSVLQVK